MAKEQISRCPHAVFLGQVVDSDLLLCTRFDSEDADLFLRIIFIQRPTNEPIFTAQNVQSIQYFLTLVISQYRKSGSTFS